MRLTAADLGATRGGEPVFSGLHFSLGVGESLVVTGPNGAGKSTLLRVVAGLLRPAEGRVGLDGGGEAFPDIASAAHYLGHRNGMKEGLTTAENLRFWRAFMGEAGLSAGEALAAVELSGMEDIPFGYLSTGQRRRAAIARLLVSRRPIWLLDEPTAGLDEASAEGFAGLMRDHLAGGGMIVAATHVDLGVGNARELKLGDD